MTNPKTVGKPRKHHYIPEGYLRGWIVSPEEKLAAFSRRDGRFSMRWAHPGGVGYELDLYTMPSLGADSDRIESQLLSLIDGGAAEVLRKARTPESRSIVAADRPILASFITSLLVRSPESLTALREGVARWWRASRPEMQEIYALTVWQPGMPESVDDALALFDEEGDEDRFLASVLPELIAHRNIKSFLGNMYWRAIHLPRSAPKLLTSDQPLLMTNGLSQADGHLAIPISPTAFLMAARSGARMDKLLRSTGLVDLAQRSNLLVTQRARKFVFAHNDRCRPFVEEHFGRSPVSAVGQKVGQGDPWKAAHPDGYIPGRALESYAAWRATVEG